MRRKVRILVATGNPGKVREFEALLPGRELVGLKEASEELGRELVMPEETGTCYEENARLKALSLCRASGLPTVADDSGLEVAALDGRPGLHSSRYANSDGERIERLLAELAAFAGAVDRSARFVCVTAFAFPGSEVECFFGECPGRIVDERAGASGFGFDPVFFLPDRGCTMAEVGEAIKNEISHRGRAFAQLRDWLERLESA